MFLIFFYGFLLSFIMLLWIKQYKNNNFTLQKQTNTTTKKAH